MSIPAILIFSRRSAMAAFRSRWHALLGSTGRSRRTRSMRPLACHLGPDLRHERRHVTCNGYLDGPALEHHVSTHPLAPSSVATATLEPTAAPEASASAIVQSWT